MKSAYFTNHEQQRQSVKTRAFYKNTSPFTFPLTEEIASADFSQAKCEIITFSDVQYDEYKEAESGQFLCSCIVSAY